MVWDLFVIHFPAFHYNLLSIASGLNPRQLIKGFPFQSGLDSFCRELLLQFSKQK